MISRYFIASALAISVGMVPATKAQADAGDALAGFAVGAIVGAAANNHARNQRAAQQNQRVYEQRTTRKKTYRAAIPATQQGREIQSSLNYFGFNAGSVDGQLGRQSKAAVGRYQAFMGFPATGDLTPYQLNILTSSYYRAQSGAPDVQQTINRNGVRGVLKATYAQLNGQPAQPQTAAQTAPTTTVVVNPQPAPVAAPKAAVAAAAPSQAPTPAAPVTEAAADAPALPNFFGQGSQASLASHCNAVSLVTNTNGGFTTLASMNDPETALNEQFCLARTYAIARSEELIGQVQGFTPQQVAAQCEGFGPAVRDFVAALSVKPRDAVEQDVSDFVLGTGMSPAQLSGTARICLGVGYRTDNMDVALGSALVLYALGEKVYGELMGHHLAMGFGASKRTDAAATWYQAGLQAADGGAEAVFVPGQPERTELIRKASMQMAGMTPAGVETVQSASSPAEGLPSFSISK
ncbi:peptidoglycan-binding domain-containing protein [Sulfitobacter sp. D35]|uniref:peptidoglycan-binding domain-containing protein n=1 Tax=Sulfitobacter sp. D35 TaxID=3083252 RepID=UPI00296EC013|nr:peptidoglycan-binding domain-containing protein [Sulfitobacter sp. D35]MDW4499449.1 peptidoglycan-binding domain-containing protein [Sulfitobacter sp. D35]